MVWLLEEYTIFIGLALLYRILDSSFYQFELGQDKAYISETLFTFIFLSFVLNKQHSTMLLAKNALQETHYDVLNVKEDASQEEIRANYRSAILSLHPDKLSKISDTSSSDQTSGERFLRVQKAWEILSNSSSRLIYDNELRHSRQDVLAAEVSEDVTLQDMMAEDGGVALELYYQCRCGDYFSIDSMELGKIGYSLLRDGSRISLFTVDALPRSVILPCGSCSLKARLVINIDDTIAL